MIVIVEVAVPFAGGVTGFVEATHEASPGHPLTVRFTAALNAFSEVTVAVTWKLCPAVMVPVVGESVTANDVTGAVPVPLSGTSCGELASLSAMLRFADSAACVEGVNVTPIVQFPPAATDAPHVFVWLKSPAFVPVVDMLVIVSVAVPLFVSVTVCTGLAVPCD